MGSQSLAITLVEFRTHDSRSETHVSPSKTHVAQTVSHVSNSKSHGWSWFMLVVTALLIAGYLTFSGYIIIPAKYLYKPGDNVGYNLGLVGGSMMLLMLLYSLRKRVKFMKEFSILPKWFRWHIIFGIVGPTLVMFHSTFVIHSFNAGVALICTLLVSGSGIFGRFFYTKVHNGLYGREMMLKKLHDDLSKTGSFKESITSFAPNIKESIEKFRVRAEGGTGGFWDSVSIEFQAAFLNRSLVKELRHVMYTQAQEKKWDTWQAINIVDQLYEEYASNIGNYIKAIRDAAQFRTYERFFSLWHIFHIPLVYMLVFSGIYHVIAVHMY